MTRFVQSPSRCPGVLISARWIRARLGGQVSAGVLTPASARDPDLMKKLEAIMQRVNHS